MLAKRVQIAQRIVDLRKQVTRHKADIVQIGASIGLFATDLTEARRKTCRFARSEHFASGELTRRCREAVRQASRPISADELAVKATQDQGMDADFVQRLRVDAYADAGTSSRGKDRTWAGSNVEVAVNPGR